MDANEPVAIYSAPNLAEAEILKSVLEEEGVQCELDGENQGSFAGVLNVNILVRAQDEALARRVLADRAEHREANTSADEE